ncbi:TVP38/TMEM64 family protein [Alkalicoccus luteus]|uniref:TVP38/TMEM64 family membrane protein n=1 Tax=Alkalicoccus luteus TaxID=1237094 RepID=A0A969PN33_9BACI|nr:VTT domain-containing protein [Alkalicoccus luteus]NJP37226.1 VTT domain-containing protein [Alkalicoccus luteus]
MNKGKWVYASIIAALLLLMYVQWDTISLLRNEELDEILTLAEENRYYFLLLTIPLIVVQQLFTLFPVIVLIAVHFLLFPVTEAFFYSLLGTAAGSMLCFAAVHEFGGRYYERFWRNNKSRFARAETLIQSYSFYGIILLRSLPFMPSNLISAAAAISRIPTRTYLFSTIAGNISMVWMLSLLSAPVWIADSTMFSYFLGGYLLFSAGIIVMFFLDRRKEQTV